MIRAHFKKNTEKNETCLFTINNITFSLQINDILINEKNKINNILV